METGKRALVLTAGGAVIGLAAVFAWWMWLRPMPLPEGLIQANGRIEGDHYTVSGKVPGRIVELKVREGDAVKRGQVMARLDDAGVRAKVEQARAAADALKARLAAAQVALDTLKKQVPLRIETAKAAVAHAEAALAAAKASATQAARDARRFRSLLKEHTVDKESVEQKDLAWKVARAEFATAQAALEQAQKKRAEAELGRETLEAKQHEIEALKAQLQQARAAVAEAQSVLDDMTIVSPASGIVTTRLVETGEVVVAGSPLFDIVDLDRLYLKVYVPEKQIGKLHLGAPARIFVDAFPDRAFPATLRYIASRAEFTPKEVQTPDERVKLVYAVKLYLDENPDHRLTPGMPADAVIRWREDAPWVRPRW